MNVEFINPFIGALRNVLATMAQTELQPGKPQKKKDASAKGDVTGLIGMVGEKTAGSLSISFEENLALEIMQRMLGERPESIDEEVTDMVGEIANMICGGAKVDLGKIGFDFNMATPVVVTGKGHSIIHQVDGPKMIMPFNSDAGMAYLEICFDK